MQTVTGSMAADTGVKSARALLRGLKLDA